MKTTSFLFTLLLFSFSIFAQNSNNPLVSKLLKSKSDKVKIEAILQLADSETNQISISEQAIIKRELLKWYEQQSDAGVHSAIDYIFRPSMKGEAIRKINWHLTKELEAIDNKLVKKYKPNKRWFITSQLNTMSVIAGPIIYNMGSPSAEKYRTEDELQHQVNIPRSFAISTKEVSVAQFQKFLEANPLIKQASKLDSMKYPSLENKRLLVFSPDINCPQIYVTWYEATQYCNWLSKLEGIPESEWCYPTNEAIKSGMEIQKDYLKRKGYRLPTEAEWEYASRAGTNTSRFYGDDDMSLLAYAWYSKNPPMKKSDPIDPNDPHHTYPVGQLKPNLYGLFDVYGNVWEWCDSRRQIYKTDKIFDEPNGNFVITDSTAMIRRGGSFSYGKDVMRSAHRGATNYYPNQRRDNVGFRIAKTL